MLYLAGYLPRKCKIHVVALCPGPGHFGATKSSRSKSPLVKIAAGQNRRWSKSALVKIGAGQNRLWSKSALVKIGSGQNRRRSESAQKKKKKN